MQLKKSIVLRVVLIYLGVLIVSISGVVYYSYKNSKNVLIEKNMELHSLQLSTIDNKIDLYVASLEQLMAYTYEDSIQEILIKEENETRVDQVKRYIEFKKIYESRMETADIRNDIENIYFVYADGEVILLGDGTLNPDYNFLTNHRYLDAMEGNGKLVVLDSHIQEFKLGSPYSDTNHENSRVISIGKRIYFSNQNINNGALIIDVNLEKMEENLQPLTINDNSVTIFVNENHRIQYADEKDLVGSMLNETISEQLRNGKESGFTTVLDENEYLIYYKKNEKTNWYLISITPVSEVVKEIEKIKENTVIFVLIVLLFSVGLSLFFIRKILRPLIQLKMAVDKMEAIDGELNIEVKGEDEIASLTKAINSMSTRINLLIKENYLISMRERDAQIESLRLQINPHFLYNTLESMNCMGKVYEIEEICTIATSLADMFRYSMGHRKSLVTIQDELEHIKWYMNIQKIRFGDRLYIEYKVEECCRNKKILPIILQPLVENAIKYSVESQKVKILIQIEQLDDMIQFIIRDQGVGIAKEKIEDIYVNFKVDESNPVKEHIGLKNVNNRLKLNFGEESGIQITSEEGKYTEVLFLVPLIDEK